MELCLSRSETIADFQRCLSNQGALTREQERSEQDLNAQREMAIWAEAMLWATWIVGITSISVTAVGIFFVWQTLRETRNAVTEAARGSNAAERAVIASERANDIILRDLREKYRPRIEVAFEGPFLDPMADVKLKQDEPKRLVVLTGKLKVWNKGETIATIMQYGIKVVDPEIPNAVDLLDTDIHENLSKKGSFTLEPGEFLPLDGHGMELRSGSLKYYMDQVFALARYEITEATRLATFRRFGPILVYVIYKDRIGIVRKLSVAYEVRATGAASANRYGGDEFNREEILYSDPI